MHHKIVALDAWNVAIPPSLLQLPEPHTYELISHTTQLTSAEDIRDAVRDATIVATTITPISGATLDASNSPNLQLIVAIATGTDCIDADRAAARGIKVVNCPNCNTETVANHVLAMYFAGRRHLVQVHNTTLRTDEWTRKFSLTFALNDPEGRPPMTCRDETVGIVGYGAIGRRVAELCRALGMNVLIAARKGASASPDRAPFTQVLAQSTVLVLCVPRGPDTLGLISTLELQAMLRHALVLNVSRGGIVDEDALLAALRAGTIGGAATDVFVKEPSGAGRFWQQGDSPLLKVGADEANALNLVVTPHVAWCSTTTFHNYLQAFKRHVENCGITRPWVFDCAAYYGHHEMEIGIWRANRHKFSRGGYIGAYLDEFGYDGKAREEAEDRLKLTSAKTNFMYSARFPKSQPRIRVDILNGFHYLLNKYEINIDDGKPITLLLESCGIEAAYNMDTRGAHMPVTV